MTVTTVHSSYYGEDGISYPKFDGYHWFLWVIIVISPSTITILGIYSPLQTHTNYMKLYQQIKRILGRTECAAVAGLQQLVEAMRAVSRLEVFDECHKVRNMRINQI
jgi:hypothetical protein